MIVISVNGRGQNNISKTEHFPEPLRIERLFETLRIAVLMRSMKARLKSTKMLFLSKPLSYDILQNVSNKR